MKRFLAITLLLAACTTAPHPQPQPSSQPARVEPQRTSNAFTRVTSTKPIAEPRIRVGMLSDQASVTFARVDGGYFLIGDTDSYATRRGFSIAAPLANAPVHYAVQVSTISDQTSAEPFAEKLRTEAGVRVDALFDPATGAWRILAGDFPDSASANPLRAQLQQRGYGTNMLVVKRPSDQPFDKKLTIVDDEGEQTTMAGDSVLIQPQTADTIAIAEKAYRTAARVFINGRGSLNIINELNLEDYLRGVVPAEMGPKVFDEVEALKAQAIAARTYAVLHKAQFIREGYDICPGPACQAYLGFSGEEAMSDRAVKETAGLVITYQGKPIDALYTATCGGETSDVGVMFPGRNEPYLKRARCVENDLRTIAGRADSAMLTETQVAARMFTAFAGLPDAGASWSAKDVEAAVTVVRRSYGAPASAGDSREPASDLNTPAKAGAPPEAGAPLSSRRGDVLQYLARVFRLDENARTLTLPEDRNYFFPQSPNRESPAYLAAAFLIKWGFLPTQQVDRLDLNAAMPREELYSILGSWLRKHEALKEVTGKILSINGRSIVLKADGKSTSYTLPNGIPIFRRIGDRYQEYASVPVTIGDRAFLQLNTRKQPVALIVQGNVDGASFDRTSSFANWTRSYRADELVTAINKRNPIQQLLGLKPLTIDASQRIAEMEVTAEGGRTFVLKGLPIRWSLNVPDNLFVFEKTQDADGVDRYTFYGKGWGHGVGFCQVGAYGMAFRGWTAQQILTHYYAGVEIAAMR
jgi:stage II sporulation protein D